MSSSSIEVSDAPGRMHPSVVEAAVRYAAGHALEARRILEELLRSVPGQRRAWWMLMDLALLERRWEEYEALAARYRELFGRDAPAERARKESEERLPEALRTGGPAAFALGGQLDATSVATLARLRDAASRETVLHLDATRLETIDPAGARLLEDTLRQLIAGGCGIVLGGDDQLMRLLRRALEEEPAQRPYWELLLLLLRMAEDRAAFERLALEYALAAEVEAPSWEPLIMPQPPVAPRQERRAEPRYSMHEFLPLRGVMAGSDDPQLAVIAEYAAATRYLNIDLSRLERIDFVCGARLANLLSGLVAAEKTIRLLHPNHLVAALLELLNVDAVTSIIVLRD